ncbi:MAG: CAP domain-containing protein [Acetivibrionales bacterium]|jgi:uncharacterized YkwD family protein
MKTRIVLLIVLSLIFTTISGFILADVKKVEAAEATPVFRAVDSLNGTVEATYLNLRQGPSTEYNVVSILKKGDKVEIIGKIGEWYAVYEPGGGCVGAVHSNYVNVKEGISQPAANGLDEGKEEEEAVSVPPSDISEDEQKLLDLINEARTEAGVAPLEFDSELMEAARLKAKEMVEKNYFSHQSPTFGSPFDMMKQIGINFKTAGENIAGNKTVEGAFKAWMKSEDHKANILNSKFNYSGIGVSESKTYGKVMVLQNIGR